jgi:hypothetical protein
VPRGPPPTRPTAAARAAQERLHSVRINFSFVIYILVMCMSVRGVCMFTELVLEDDMAKKAKKAKKTAKAATKKVAKKTSTKKK